MKFFTSVKIIESFKGSNTEMIDLGGKLMLPGFIDNHTHFLSGGYNLSSVDLRKAKTKQEFISYSKRILPNNGMMTAGYLVVTGIMKHGAVNFLHAAGSIR